MCDELTDHDDAQTLRARGISRRDFAAMTAVSLLAAMPGAAAAAQSSLTEATVRFPASGGTIDAFFVHPAKGRHPGVILWPDIFGMRDSFKLMARRLAAAGYAVLAVNQFYRSAPFPVFATETEGRSPEGRARMAPWLALLTPDAIASDAAACVAFLDGQRAVNRRRGIGAQGYCQGGNFAVRSSTAVPGRIRAVGSFHGGGLVTDQPGSPHLGLPQSRAAYLIAVARNDDERSPADKDRFRQAAAAAGRPAEIEVYGGNHGWCVPDSPSYDQAEADRAHARLLALYAKL
jgi:carboxymethylenebutenolidase